MDLQKVGATADAAPVLVPEMGCSHQWPAAVAWRGVEQRRRLANGGGFLLAPWHPATEADGEPHEVAPRPTRIMGGHCSTEYGVALGAGVGFFDAGYNTAKGVEVVMKDGGLLNVRIIVVDDYLGEPWHAGKVGEEAFRDCDHLVIHLALKRCEELEEAVWAVYATEIEGAEELDQGMKAEG